MATSYIDGKNIVRITSGVAKKVLVDGIEVVPDDAAFAPALLDVIISV